MKKKKADGAVTSAREGSNQPRDQRLNSAIERVFRLTHSREMTAKERREFGLNNSNPDHKETNTKNSHLRTPKFEPELS